jgi:hypothetical protein
MPPPTMKTTPISFWRISGSNRSRRCVQHPLQCARLPLHHEPPPSHPDGWQADDQRSPRPPSSPPQCIFNIAQDKASRVAFCGLPATAEGDLLTRLCALAAADNEWGPVIRAPLLAAIGPLVTGQGKRVCAWPKLLARAGEVLSMPASGNEERRTGVSADQTGPRKGQTAKSQAINTSSAAAAWPEIRRKQADRASLTHSPPTVRHLPPPSRRPSQTCCTRSTSSSTTAASSRSCGAPASPTGCWPSLVRAIGCTTTKRFLRSSTTA